MMVASGSILSSGFMGDYFIKPHTSDYYIGRKEERGLWFGKGAARLGLEGNVQPKPFALVLQGCHPATGKSLIKSRTGDRVPGMDITFSVPKSVSTLAVTMPADKRREMVDCILSSVRQTLSFAEETIPLLRFGKDGSQQRKGEILAALFPHFTNRSGDPQIHVHAVISNLSWDGNKRFVGINTKELFDWLRTLGPIFRTFLAEQLRDRFGLDLYIPVDSKGNEQSWFEIRGVSKSLCDAWSSRSKEINEYLADDLAMGNITAGTKADANKATRKDKDRLPHIDVLESHWQEQIKRDGFSLEQVSWNVEKPSLESVLSTLDQSLHSASDHLLAGNAYFNPKDLVRYAIEKVQHTGVNPIPLIEHITKKLGDSHRWIHLSGKDWNRKLTTPEMWRLEEKLLDDASSLRERIGVRVGDKILRDIIRSNPSFSEEQVTVLKDLTQRKNGMRILEGVAGSGKTTVLDAVRQAFERSGHRVIGGSLSGLATQNLSEEAHISSRTIASYLHHLDKSFVQKAIERVLHDVQQLVRAAMDKSTHRHDPVRIPKRGVLILDEAGMIDTKSMERLLHHARRAKATVILVGDRKQLQPIAAGGPFRFLADKYVHVSLTANYRQRSEDDRIAVKQVREGFSKQALESYIERNLLTVTKTRSDSAKQIAKAWAENGGSLNPKDHIVLTETRREARLLNRMCQDKRLADGHLNPRSTITVDGNRFYQGDRILFLKPDRKQGIENGSRGTIASIDPSSDQVKILLDNPRKGYPSCVALGTKKLSRDQITLSYAGTVHKLQGQSTEHAYVLLGGGMTDNNMAYTQLTRAKASTRIFVDKSSAGDDLCRIAKRISLARSKLLAQELRSRNDQEIQR